MPIFTLIVTVAFTPSLSFSAFTWSYVQVSTVLPPSFISSALTFAVTNMRLVADVPPPPPAGSFVCDMALPFSS